jgi:hypothetical protein
VILPEVLERITREFHTSVGCVGCGEDRKCRWQVSPAGASGIAGERRVGNNTLSEVPAGDISPNNEWPAREVIAAGRRSQELR